MCRISPLPPARPSLSDPIGFNRLVAGRWRCDSLCLSTDSLLKLVEPPLIDRCHLPVFGGNLVLQGGLSASHEKVWSVAV